MSGWASEGAGESLLPSGDKLLAYIFFIIANSVSGITAVGTGWVFLISWN